MHESRSVPEQHRQGCIERHHDPGREHESAALGDFLGERCCAEIHARKLAAVGQRGNADDDQKQRGIDGTEHGERAEALATGAKGVQDQRGRGDAAEAGFSGGFHHHEGSRWQQCQRDDRAEQGYDRQQLHGRHGGEEQRGERQRLLGVDLDALANPIHASACRNNMQFHGKTLKCACNEPGHLLSREPTGSGRDNAAARRSVELYPSHRFHWRCRALPRGCYG